MRRASADCEDDEAERELAKVLMANSQMVLSYLAANQNAHWHFPFNQKLKTSSLSLSGFVSSPK